MLKPSYALSCPRGIGSGSPHNKLGFDNVHYQGNVNIIPPRSWRWRGVVFYVLKIEKHIFLAGWEKLWIFMATQSTCDAHCRRKRDKFLFVYESCSEKDEENVGIQVLDNLCQFLRLRFCNYGIGTCPPHQMVHTRQAQIDVNGETTPL